MSRDETFSDSFDDALDEILPADLEEAAPNDDASSVKWWVEKNYTFAQHVCQDTRQEVARSKIRALSSDLGVSSNVPTLAVSLFNQYDAATDSMHVVELYAGAALYCACKVVGEAVDPSDFDDLDGELLTRKTLLRRSKRIATELGLDVSAFTDSSQYIDRYCDELDLEDEVCRRAHEIVELCNDAGLNSGMSPTGWAAAAVYNASLELGRRVTQSDVAKVAKVTEVTIRNRYQEQREFITTHESAATDPGDTINRIQRRLGLDETIASEAKSLLDTAEDAGLQISGEKWGVAAISVVSKTYDELIGYRSLTSYTTVGSDKIRECENKLKKTRS